ncbi:proteinase inhibitor I25 cystatin [Echinococcus multilocularis]|uniref:Proteinase inhibitor I25 cystatin n=1 Tax=Echinococcus multilocularis TaxID=6211 RepID=A0A068Y8P6_ECHMU|nr:proteinase inhibitor I25 cystatin [Echinococcus multilocularis]
MNRFVLLFLSFLVAVSIACRQQERSVAVSSPRGIVGGITPITKEDMNEMMFQDALTEVMKNLDEVNECHSFRLVEVIEATQQVVAGMKYVVKLEVTPIYSSDNDEECLKPCYLNLSGNKQAIAAVVYQPWRNPKHHITFKPNNEGSADFSKNGKLITSCELREGTILSSKEMTSKQFQEMVRSGIERLDRNASRCFRYELMDVIEGKRMMTSNLKYEWRMKVKRIYDESMPGCIGACADDCSGIEIYRASALASMFHGGAPEILSIEYQDPTAL